MDMLEKIIKAQSCKKPDCKCGKPAENGGYFAHCPNHPDENDPKLLVREDDNHKVVATCYGPCQQEEVDAALKKKGLGEDDPPTGDAKGESKADTTDTPTDAGNPTEAIKAVSMSTKKGTEVQKMKEKQIKAESNTKNGKTGEDKLADTPAKGQGQPKSAGKLLCSGKKLPWEQWEAEVQLKFNPHFENLFGECKALPEDTLEHLTHSLLHDPGGCRDPIRVWHGDVVDGHNRLAVCREHGLPFMIEEIAAETEQDVKIWMLRNQLGRRNLSKEQRAILVLLMKDPIAAKAKLNQKLSGVGKKGLSMLTKPVHTQEEMAKEAGVSAGTMYKADHVNKKAPEKLEEVYQGKKSINMAFNELQPEAKAKKMASGKPKAVSQNKTSVAKTLKEPKLEVKSEPVHAVQETVPDHTSQPPMCGFHKEKLVCPSCFKEWEKLSEGDEDHVE